MAKNGNGHKSVTAIDDTTEYEKVKAAALEAVRREQEVEASGDTEFEFETGYDYHSLGEKLGVLQRAITAVKDKREYLQILLLAAFDDKREALLAADAISERQRYGVEITPILNRVVSQCAVHADRLDRVLKAMSSYNINTSQSAGKAPRWKREQENKMI